MNASHCAHQPDTSKLKCHTSRVIKFSSSNKSFQHTHSLIHSLARARFLTHSHAHAYIHTYTRSLTQFIHIQHSTYRVITFADKCLHQRRHSIPSGHKQRIPNSLRWHLNTTANTASPQHTNTTANTQQVRHNKDSTNKQMQIENEREATYFHQRFTRSASQRAL